LFVDDILKLFYVVSHLRQCVLAHMRTYYDISWPLSALISVSS